MSAKFLSRATNEISAAMIPQGMSKAATGRRIEILREAMRYRNASAFAKHVGFTASQLKNYESGLQYPRMDQLDKLQRTTLAGLDYILRGDLSSTPYDLASRIRAAADEMEERKASRA